MKISIYFITLFIGSINKPNGLDRNQKVAASGWGGLTRWGHKAIFWDNGKILNDDTIVYSCQNAQK